MSPEKKWDMLNIPDLSFTYIILFFLTGLEWIIFIKRAELLLDSLIAEAEILQPLKVELDPVSKLAVHKVI